MIVGNEFARFLMGTIILVYTYHTKSRLGGARFARPITYFLVLKVSYKPQKYTDLLS